MAHQSLYRKYRPDTFDDMVGQQHIERTLRNAVAQDCVAHAYLLTGPRGTGKTSTARLLAKALLCDNGPSDTPDGSCQSCLEIAQGNHPDVIELDAASRNGVEAVRTEIIERVFYAPVRGKYKVYIIDEVHMLSTGAFNAMLKTLEEPPSHVVFILCTTDPQKVPDTIQSRCQRFDFHPISSEQIVERLRFIAESEGIRVDRASYALIAKHADGGMRDAITVLEQLSAYTGNDISVDDVEGALGEVSTVALAELMSAVAQRDTAACFHWVADQVETGADLPELIHGLLAYVRDMYVMGVLENSDGLINVTDDDRIKMRSLTGEFEGPDRIARIIDLLTDVSGEMRYSTEPRTVLELALVRTTRVDGEYTLEALAERIERLERGLSAVPAISRPVARAAAEPAKPVQQAVAKEIPPKEVPISETEPESLAPQSGGSLNAGTVKRSWRAVLAEIKKQKASRSLFFADASIEFTQEGTLLVTWPKDGEFKMKAAQDNKELLANALFTVFGSNLPFEFRLGKNHEPVLKPEPVRNLEPSEPAEPFGKPEPEPPIAQDPGPMAEVDSHSQTPTGSADALDTHDSLLAEIVALGGKIEKIESNVPKEDDANVLGDSFDGGLVDPDEEQLSFD
ncbi:MAG: DNA polymerase III subunit gamma/tau [Coriobacteriia bacterium]|nr:DNA polymerase III subunit gamma/tau [Coriobacteriia bacterium]